MALNFNKYYYKYIFLKIYKDYKSTADGNFKFGVDFNGVKFFFNN